MEDKASIYPLLCITYAGDELRVQLDESITHKQIFDKANQQYATGAAANSMPQGQHSTECSADATEA
eukprot:gene5372-2428_t